MLLLLNSDIIDYVNSFLTTSEIANLSVTCKCLNERLEGILFLRYKQVKKDLLISWLYWCLHRGTSDGYIYLPYIGGPGEVSVSVLQPNVNGSYNPPIEYACTFKGEDDGSSLLKFLGELDVDSGDVSFKIDLTCPSPISFNSVEYYGTSIALFFTPTNTENIDPEIRKCYPEIDKFRHLALWTKGEFFTRLKHDMFFPRIYEMIVERIRYEEALADKRDYINDKYEISWELWSKLIDQIRFGRN